MSFLVSQSITPVKGVALWGAALPQGEVSIQDLIDDFFEFWVQRLIILGFLLDCVCYCSCGIDISITIMHCSGMPQSQLVRLKRDTERPSHQRPPSTPATGLTILRVPSPHQRAENRKQTSRRSLWW